MCRRGDLNSYGSPRLLLRQVRLPISPPRHFSETKHVFTYLLRRRRESNPRNVSFANCCVSTSPLRQKQEFRMACPCPPGRIRTYDHLLKRELLYQLSYRGNVAQCSKIALENQHILPYPILDKSCQFAIICGKLIFNK